MELVLSLLLILVIVVALCAVTELVFVDALEAIAERWQLPSSVAGATLMAVGSSAPELMIALLSLFRDGGAHSDLGIGTIVGSAVFNILVITGVSGLARPAFARKSVILRDAVAYLLTVALLSITIRDGAVTTLEAVALLLSYGVYLVTLFFWKQDELHDPVENAGESLFPWEKTVKQWTMFFSSRPFAGFIFSVLLIGVLCWGLVSEAISVSETLGVPPILIGLTVIAGATSLPDLLSSVAASRRGKGEEALANAVGSNVFDISVGLCVPWLLAIWFFSSEVRVGTKDLWESIAVLASTVALFVALALRKGCIGRKEGLVLLVTYIAYIAYIVL